MPQINLTYTRVPADKKKYGGNYTFNSISIQDFQSFNHKVLGLGDLSKGSYSQSLAAFLDLEGFTDFCNQIDSHLVIPEFIKRYLEWLFEEIANEFKEGETKEYIRIWGSLPFYTKFLGDGILFLWDTEKSGGFSGICNIITRLNNIRIKYKTEFVPLIQKHVSKPPLVLRCGISRGQVISLGNGQDYVGSCINIASRLQKISNLTFVISRRGFDLSQIDHDIAKLLTLKKIQIRGISDEELVWILKNEYENLPDKEKKLFRSP